MEVCVEVCVGGWVGGCVCVCVEVCGEVVLASSQAGALLAYLQSYGAVEAVAAQHFRSWTPRDAVAGNFELVRFAEATAAALSTAPFSPSPPPPSPPFPT